MLESLKTLIYRLKEALKKFIQPLFDRHINLPLQPVFVVGCGHSGTTLLVSLIGKHPSFHFIPFETYIFRPHRSFKQIQDFFLQTMAEAKDKRILEKTPRHVADMQRIFRIFPEARVIAIIRDGRDVACSLKKRDIPLQKGIRRWVRDCGYISAFEKDPRVLTLKYEDLVKQQSRTLNTVFEFLQETPIAEDILQEDRPTEWNYSWTTDIEKEKPEEAARRKKHLERRKAQINEPIYDDSEKWREKLDQEQIELIYSEAAQTLEKWGYK